MTEKQSGVLHLIPVALCGDNAKEVLPESVIEIARQLDYFLAENEKSARQFLRTIEHPLPLRQLEIKCFDRHADTALAEHLLLPLQAGRSAGVLSEAGCPAIADPGALLVSAAHRYGLRIVPHVGPSSLLLALMASGCNGQHFQFHGYLPTAREECRIKLRLLERESRTHDRTEIFIETPYRCEVLLKTLLETCAGSTRLCVATDLTLPTESVRSMLIAEWKKQRKGIGKAPSVFLLYASRVP
jgi:16S rRNA (cytidine1402-2'-O)-methyltransferase